MLKSDIEKLKRFIKDNFSDSVMKRKLIDKYIEQKIYMCEEPSVSQLVAITEKCGVKVIKETPEQLRAWVSKIKCFSQAPQKPAAHYNPCKATKEELEELYVNQGLSTMEIAKKLNTSSNSVQSRMRVYGIKLRSHKVANKKKEIDKKEFKMLYSAGYTIAQLCTHFQASKRLINKKFEEFGIEKRSQSESASLRGRKVA